MNIAIFASAFHPHVGGVEELCRQLAHEYRARGDAVAVFTERWPRSLPEHEVYEGIPVHRLPFRVWSEGWKAKLKYVATHRLIRRRLLALLRAFRPDILHVQCVSNNARYALEMQAAGPWPLVVTLQGELTMDAQQIFQRSALARDTLRRALQRADAVTACSRQTLAEAEAFFGAPLGERARVVYNGIAAGETCDPFPHPRPYLLAIGRHVPQKGFDVLLRAWAELNLPCDLILAGDGPEHPTLRALADELRLTNVRFPGRVTHAMAMRLFAGCTIFVLPSRHEPFGIVNLEAMTHARPIVASRVGGVPEIVSDDHNGLLVPPGEPGALADAIARLLGDAALRRRLGEAGRARAARFTWPRIADEYRQVYAAATKAPPRSRSMTDLIFVSMEDWDEVWRRNQFVCAELARRAPARRILFVGLQRNLLRCLVRGEWSSIWRDPTWTVPGRPNITVTTPLRVMPERFDWGRRFNESLTRRHVRRVAAALDLRAPVLWLNPHTAVHLLGRMGEAASVYDITDDWEEMDQPPALKAAISAQDARLGTKADAVIVCSAALRAAKEAKFRRRVHLIPNGVDADHYRAVAEPASGQRWARPVLGYTGTLHSERVDVDLVCRLAMLFSHGSIVLVGPNLLKTSERQRLESFGNVHLTGAVPYRELPGRMRAFDVCIVPHRVTAFTESLNPIKLWEYLAAGKPIVSTRVAGFRDYPALVRLADTAETFAHEVNAALTESPDLAEVRRAEARGHSWQRRVDEIEAVIASCLPR